MEFASARLAWYDQPTNAAALLLSISFLVAVEHAVSVHSNIHYRGRP